MRIQPIRSSVPDPVERFQAKFRSLAIPSHLPLVDALRELDSLYAWPRENPGCSLGKDSDGRLISCLCNEELLRSASFQDWLVKMRRGPEVMHRKHWEWAYICQALHERGMLVSGRSGAGFAVGQEPLASLFCSLGCNILATDFDAEAANRAGWVSTGQHAGSLDALNQYGLAEADEFRARTRFQVVDMCHLPVDLGPFDFVWSACAIEHLGDIDAGIDYVLNSYDLLRPGGVAIHTTEFNMDSNWTTIGFGADSIFRRCDLELLGEKVRSKGGRIQFDFREGNLPADRHVDIPPFKHVPHLRLELFGYRCTSFGLIIEKPT